MFDKDFLKTLTIIYVEDDKSIRESLGSIFQKIFKEVVLCIDGEDGLNKFILYTNELKIPIDAIVSDINMPKMNGLEMLAKIRELDTEVPAVMTTAHGESDFLMEAIKVNVSHYALKPINTPDLLKNLQKFCYSKYQQKLIIKKEKELSSYIDIIDQVATITKIDKDGNFIDANELFCEISYYSKDEIITKNISDVTHKDITLTIYKNMYDAINKGENWEGLYKSIDKNNDIFYLRISAIPDFKINTNQMDSCTFIGFVATEDEQERRDTMQKVRQNIIEQRKKAYNLQTKIKDLEAEQNKTPAITDTSFLHESLEKAKIKNNELLNQVEHYEKELKNLQNKFNSLTAVADAKREKLVEKYKKMGIENKILSNKLITAQNRLDNVATSDMLKQTQHLREIALLEKKNDDVVDKLIYKQNQLVKLEVKYDELRKAKK